jgi:imidazolonepropionase-like amidohydrolase
MAAILFRNVQVWDGVADDRFPGEVLIVGNRIAKVARGEGQMAAEQAAETIDGSGLTLMPGLVEGHCHLSFCNPLRNQDLGEIPPEEHLLQTCRNATFILNHGFTSCYSAASAKLRIDVVVRQEIENGYLAGCLSRRPPPPRPGARDHGDWRPRR